MPVPSNARRRVGEELERPGGTTHIGRRTKDNRVGLAQDPPRLVSQLGDVEELDVCSIDRPCAGGDMLREPGRMPLTTGKSDRDPDVSFG